MATFDLTSKDTTGIFSDSIVAMPSAKNTNVMRNIEAYLDIDALVAAGGSFSDGDIFQVLEILILGLWEAIMLGFFSLGRGKNILTPPGPAGSVKKDPNTAVGGRPEAEKS